MTTIPNNKRIVIIGGGTNSYISNHLALSAPAYGSTAKKLANKFRANSENQMQVDLYLTKMAQQAPGNPDTPEEVEALVDRLVADPNTRVIVFNVAMVDYKPLSLYTEKAVAEGYDQVLLTQDFGKYTQRLSTSKDPYINLELKPYDKIINKIRKERKDILLVGFKTTCGATKEEQYNKGLKLCKDASANIVFVNDVDEERISELQKCIEYFNKNEKPFSILKEKIDTGVVDETDQQIYLHYNQQYNNWLNRISKLQNNGLVTPEESSYWYNTRDEALDSLVQMVLDRSHLHFTRSTVVDSETVPWNIRKTSSTLYTTPIVVEPKKREYIPNPIIPETFRTVFDWVRSQGAYKQGPTGSTVGHMGIKLGPNEFLTTKRKTDFNKMEEVGLVRVITDDPDDVFGYRHFFETEDEVDTRLQLEEAITKLSNTQDIEKRQNIKFNINYFNSRLRALRLQKDDKVIAFGAKPSVGGQSQRSLFDTFPDLNCIIHFHCPLKTEHRTEFNTTPQFGVECGSHECGQNTAMNMKEFRLPSGRSVWAVHLDHHGPNIIFNSTTADPQEIIDFIGTHWALDKRTTGLSDELI